MSTQHAAQKSKVVAGISPKNATPATIDGAGIDRSPPGSMQQYESVELHLACGAATGAPTAQTVDAKLQDSATVGGTYADVVGGAVVQLTADDTESRVKLSVKGAKEFLRVRVVVALTAGTAPAIPVAATLKLDGAREVPPA